MPRYAKSGISDHTIIDAYQRGLSIRAIVKKYHVTHGRTSKLLQAAGIPIRNAKPKAAPTRCELYGGLPCYNPECCGRRRRAFKQREGGL